MVGKVLSSLLRRSRRSAQAADAEAMATRLGLGDRAGIRTPGGANYLLGAAAQSWKAGINKTGGTIPANSLVAFDGVDATSGLPKLKAVAAGDVYAAIGVTLHALANNGTGRYLDFAPAHIIRVPSGVNAGERVSPYNSGSSWIASVADPAGPLLVKALLGAAGSNYYAVAAWAPPVTQIASFKISSLSPLKGKQLTDLDPVTYSTTETSLTDLGNGCLKVDDVIEALYELGSWTIRTRITRLKSST